MSYDNHEPWGNPRNDPFFSEYFSNTAAPKSAEGVWPDHCQQSGSNRKFGLSSHPVFDENLAPPHGDSVTAAR
jgi:hypothetical protein